MNSRFGLKFTVLALAGTLFFSTFSPMFLPTAAAATPARWKSPKIEVVNEADNVQISQPRAQVSQVNTAVYRRDVEDVSNSGNGAIRQVQFGSPQESDASRIDRTFPESRPQSGGAQQSIAPPVAPGRSGIIGEEMSNLNRRLNLLEAEADLDMNGTASTTPFRRNTQVNIICPPESAILKPLKDIDTDIRIRDTSSLPKECGFGGATVYPIRDWNRICFTWKASGLCHKPLYFEEESLERYGHTHVREEFQPIVSAAKFFLTIPILPYKMGLNPPNECIYTLGYYRPGDCAPYMLDPLPLSLRAGLIQAGATVGAVAIFP